MNFPDGLWEDPKEGEGVSLEGNFLLWWWTEPFPARIVQSLDDFIRNGPPEAAKNRVKSDIPSLEKLFGFLSGIDVV